MHVTIHGIQAQHVKQVEDAFIGWAREHANSPDLMALCPAGRTLLDWMHVLDAGTHPFAADDAPAVAIVERAGIRRITLPHYKVRADADSGMWLGKPERIGDVNARAWMTMRDTEAAHYDEAEIDGQQAALTVEWA